MDDKANKAGEVSIVKTSPEDQKASCNAVPSTLSHQNPHMQPVAGHCMKGGKYQ